MGKIHLPGVISGQLTLEVTCADSVALINVLTEKQIPVKNITYKNNLVFHITVFKKNYAELKQITDRLGGSIKTIGRSGPFWMGKAVLKRPVLLMFLTTMFLLSIYIPSRVLFISIEGNTSVPAKLILEAAEECGIRFGVSRRKIRSEVMKNSLLQKVPQLQWAGINTSGCTAVISVKEKSTVDEKSESDHGVCSIVATRDGIIQNCTVYQGNPLCTVGQAVKAGETLVSGYLDCGIITKAIHAKAEIRALTLRDLEVVTPTPIEVRGVCYKQRVNYRLLIGKKVINLSKDSGNYATTCAKIYSETYLQLPGGFRLPVAVVKETQYFYEKNQETSAASDADQWLTNYAKDHLQDTMLAGEIISEKTDVSSDGSATYLSGKYTCMEIIGQTKYELTILKDEENDGENRKFRSG